MTHSNIPEFSSVFLDDKFLTQSKETNLWRAVISQALYDLTLPPSNREYILWRNRVLNWFKSDNEDFILVCEYANLSVKDILAQAEIIKKAMK